MQQEGLPRQIYFFTLAFQVPLDIHVDSSSPVPATAQAASARMMMDKLTLVHIIMTVNPCGKRLL